MQNVPFTLYSASAGSGKTYALTKAYLSLLLADGSPLKFRQLLALTFTNKAVAELKTRILDNLHHFARWRDPAAAAPLFRELCYDLVITPQQLQQRTKQLLKRILHNYAFFEISTIDKFNHKLVKTFARDLQLSQHFEVELDTDALLEEAVGQLLERAGGDTALTQALLAFGLEKIEADKSWNIAYDLVAMGKLLFQETHARPLEALRTKTIRDFRELQQQLAAHIQAIETQAVAAAQHVLRKIAAQGFAASDFPRQTLPNHFKKIASQVFTPKTLYNNQLEQKLREGKLLKAADTRDAAPLAPLLLEHFLALKHQLYQRSYLKNRYDNLVPLSLLNEIARELKTIEKERDLIPITALNTLLAAEIRDQPVPFIYERMGEKYRHYFIDEFQDTSQMQWHNLIPLLGNALESEDENHQRGSVFLVGDVKQAIYRWRGGKAEQLLHLVQGKAQPFVVPPTLHTLDTNWRSCEQIIHFNNCFFATIAPVLHHPAYQHLFLHGSQQKTNLKTGGVVHLSFIAKDPDNKDEAYCQAVLETIEELTAHRYPYADLCILVRDNAKARLLADFLAQHHIPIVSSEALLLHTHPKVRFLVALLTLMDNPSDREAAYDVLLFLAQAENDTHTFITTHLNHMAKLLRTRYGFSIAQLSGQPALHILEKAIIQFDLADDAPAYLTFFMDEVLGVQKKNGPGIYTFLSYWQQKKASLSIAAPQHLNAVTVMTIHKAKGLEFPFVIFPFANAVLDDKRKKKKAWVPTTPQEQGLGMDAFLINNTREMLEYNPLAAQVYRDEQEKTVLDSINVLYVALTRAKQGLYILSETEKEAGTLSEVNTYAGLFRYYLQQQHVPNNNAQQRYTFGTLVENPNPTPTTLVQTPTVPYITRAKNDAGFTLATRSNILWEDERREAVEMGNLVHLALAEVTAAADIPQVLENLQQAGHVQQNTLPQLQQQLHAVVQHPELYPYFSAQYEVWNERDILTPAGTVLRPDRILHAQNHLVLIEYKTGKPSPVHQQQVVQYLEALKAMDFEVQQALIVYIGAAIHCVTVPV